MFNSGRQNPSLLFTLGKMSRSLEDPPFTLYLKGDLSPSQAEGTNATFYTINMLIREPHILNLMVALQNFPRSDGLTLPRETLAPRSSLHANRHSNVLVFYW